MCVALGLGPLLERMPSGLEQIVGDTGWQLSHGEPSRVFLARALLKDPDLMLRDETLAPLDASRSRGPWPSLERARTLVVISQ